MGALEPPRTWPQFVASLESMPTGTLLSTPPTLSNTTLSANCFRLMRACKASCLVPVLIIGFAPAGPISHCSAPNFHKRRFQESSAALRKFEDGLRS